jgi:glycosyltransferase involved in cell wall biosynthesis
MPENDPFINNRRKIFCVITQGELGGAQQFVAQLARNIDHEKFDMHVVWGSDSEPALGRTLPPQVSHAIAKNLVRNISPLHDLKAIPELRTMMRAYRPDIVLCISSKAGFVGAIAANGLRGSLPNLRVVYRIGGWSFNDPNPGWKRSLYTWLERFSARWKDIIVVNNSHDLQQARELGIRPRRGVSLIYNGIDPYLPILSKIEARQWLDGRIPEEYRYERYDWLVGTIANLYPAKDIASFVKAATQVNGNVRFIVIGDGPQRAEIQKLILNHGLAGRFFLLGRITDAAKYLQAIDVFVLPSAKEGFPWALLEAMAAKVPVISTRVGAVPEMIEDSSSGIIVEPGQPEQLATGINELLADERLRRELAIKAHQNVISRFSLREMIESYERLFMAQS